MNDHLRPFLLVPDSMSGHTSLPVSTRPEDHDKVSTAVSSVHITMTRSVSSVNISMTKSVSISS